MTDPILRFYWLLLIANFATTRIAGEALACNGDLYFHVQNVTNFREPRDYFFHTSADSIQDCARKCYGNLFCFSVGYAPRVNDKAACLFSYKSGYGCTKRALVKTLEVGRDELVVECMRCPAAGDLTSPPPNLSGIDGFGLGVGQNVSLPDLGVAGGTVVDGSGGTAVDGGGSVQPGTTIGCRSAVSFQVLSLGSLGAGEYSFDRQVSLDTPAECASACFGESSCKFASFNPEATALDGKKGTCSWSTNSQAIPELSDCGDTALTQYQATENVLLACFKCPGGLTGAVIDTPVITRPSQGDLLWFCHGESCSSCDQGRCPKDTQLFQDEGSCNNLCPLTPDCYFCRDGSCQGAFELGCTGDNIYSANEECSAVCGVELATDCWLLDTVSQDCVANSGVLCLPPPASSIRVYASQQECQDASQSSPPCFTMERTPPGCVQLSPAQCQAMTALHRFKFASKEECDAELNTFATAFARGPISFSAATFEPNSVDLSQYKFAEVASPAEAAFLCHASEACAVSVVTTEGATNLRAYFIPAESAPQGISSDCSSAVLVAEVQSENIPVVVSCFTYGAIDSPEFQSTQLRFESYSRSDVESFTNSVQSYSEVVSAQECAFLCHADAACRYAVVMPRTSLDAPVQCSLDSSLPDPEFKCTDLVTQLDTLDGAVLGCFALGETSIDEPSTVKETSVDSGSAAGQCFEFQPASLACSPVESARCSQADSKFLFRSKADCDSIMSQYQNGLQSGSVTYQSQSFDAQSKDLSPYPVIEVESAAEAAFLCKHSMDCEYTVLSRAEDSGSLMAHLIPDSDDPDCSENNQVASEQLPIILHCFGVAAPTQVDITEQPSSSSVYFQIYGIDEIPSISDIAQAAAFEVSSAQECAFLCHKDNTCKNAILLPRAQKSDALMCVLVDNMDGPEFDCQWTTNQYTSLEGAVLGCFRIGDADDSSATAAPVSNKTSVGPISFQVFDGGELIGLETLGSDYLEVTNAAECAFLCHADRNCQFAVIQPRDSESVPFKCTLADEIEGVELDCTNRVQEFDELNGAILGCFQTENTATIIDSVPDTKGVVNERGFCYIYNVNKQSCAEASGDDCLTGYDSENFILYKTGSDCGEKLNMELATFAREGGDILFKYAPFPGNLTELEYLFTEIATASECAFLCRAITDCEFAVVQPSSIANRLECFLVKNAADPQARDCADADNKASGVTALPVSGPVMLGCLELVKSGNGKINASLLENIDETFTDSRQCFVFDKKKKSCAKLVGADCLAPDLDRYQTYGTSQGCETELKRVLIGFANNGGNIFYQVQPFTGNVSELSTIPYSNVKSATECAFLCRVLTACQYAIVVPNTNSDQIEDALNCFFSEESDPLDSQCTNKVESKIYGEVGIEVTQPTVLGCLQFGKLKGSQVVDGAVTDKPGTDISIAKCFVFDVNRGNCVEVAGTACPTFAYSTAAECQNAAAGRPIEYQKGKFQFGIYQGSLPEEGYPEGTTVVSAAECGFLCHMDDNCILAVVERTDDSFKCFMLSKDAVQLDSEVTCSEMFSSLQDDFQYPVAISCFQYEKVDASTDNSGNGFSIVDSEVVCYVSDVSYGECQEVKGTACILNPQLLRLHKTREGCEQVLERARLGTPGGIIQFQPTDYAKSIDPAAASVAVMAASECAFLCHTDTVCEYAVVDVREDSKDLFCFFFSSDQAEDVPCAALVSSVPVEKATLLNCFSFAETESVIDAGTSTSETKEPTCYQYDPNAAVCKPVFSLETCVDETASSFSSLESCQNSLATETPQAVTTEATTLNTIKCFEYEPGFETCDPVYDARYCSVRTFATQELCYAASLSSTQATTTEEVSCFVCDVRYGACVNVRGPACAAPPGTDIATFGQVDSCAAACVPQGPQQQCFIFDSEASICNGLQGRSCEAEGAVLYATLSECFSANREAITLFIQNNLGVQPAETLKCWICDRQARSCAYAEGAVCDPPGDSGIRPYVTEEVCLAECGAEPVTPTIASVIDSGVEVRPREFCYSCDPQSFTCTLQQGTACATSNDQLFISAGSCGGVCVTQPLTFQTGDMTASNIDPNVYTRRVGVYSVKECAYLCYDAAGCSESAVTKTSTGQLLCHFSSDQSTQNCVADQLVVESPFAAEALRIYCIADRKAEVATTDYVLPTSEPILTFPPLTQPETTTQAIPAPVLPSLSADCRPADFFFILDSSKSVSSAYYTQLQWILDTVQAFSIAPSLHRVAVFAYNGDIQKLEIGFDDFSAKAPLMANISTLPYYRGTTPTGLALSIAKEVIKKTQRRDVATFVIVVTDGLSQDEVSLPASRLRTEVANARVYAVGATELVYKDELLEITGGQEDRVLIRQGPSAFLDLIKDYITCTESDLSQVIVQSNIDTAPAVKEELEGQKLTEDSSTASKVPVFVPPTYICDEATRTCQRCELYSTCPLDSQIFDDPASCAAGCSAGEVSSATTVAPLILDEETTAVASALLVYQCADGGGCQSCDPSSDCSLDRPIFDSVAVCSQACSLEDSTHVAVEQTSEAPPSCYVCDSGRMCVQVFGVACSPPADASIAVYSEKDSCMEECNSCGIGEQMVTREQSGGRRICENTCDPKECVTPQSFPACVCEESLVRHHGMCVQPEQCPGCTDELTFNMAKEPQSLAIQFDKCSLTAKASDCADLCFRTPLCQTAGMAEQQNGTIQCCFSVNQTCGTDDNYQRGYASQLDSYTVAVISCLQCGPGTASVIKEDAGTLNTVEQPVLLKEQCTSDFSFTAIQAENSQGTMTFDKSVQLTIPSLAECVKMCYEDTNCKSAGYMPNGFDNTTKCFLSNKGLEEGCGGGARLNTKDILDTPVSMFIGCISCVSENLIVESSDAADKSVDLTLKDKYQCSELEELELCGRSRNCQDYCSNFVLESPVCPLEGTDCQPVCKCKDGFVRSEFNSTTCISKSNCNIEKGCEKANMKFSWSTTSTAAILSQRDSLLQQFAVTSASECAALCYSDNACLSAGVASSDQGAFNCLLFNSSFNSDCSRADRISNINLSSDVLPLQLQCIICDKSNQLGGCSDTEIYQVCGTACPLTCQQPSPLPCTRQCLPGCFCAEGLLRDASTGNCVSPDSCPSAAR